MRNITRDPPPDKPQRPVYHIIIEPEPACDDPIRNLRALIKHAERRLKLRCISSEALR